MVYFVVPSNHQRGSAALHPGQPGGGGLSGLPGHVRVKKNSDHQTSIQWGEDGPSQCPEFARMAAESGGRHIYQRCERLAASIEGAVRDGAVTIGAEDGW
jgi:hypothetical protein